MQTVLSYIWALLIAVLLRPAQASLGIEDVVMSDDIL